MNVANEQKAGTLKISDEVIAVCAANATLKTDGVAELAGGFTNTLSRKSSGKRTSFQGSQSFTGRRWRCHRHIRNCTLSGEHSVRRVGDSGACEKGSGVYDRASCCRC